ncbi:MAG TPA: aromatic amino acid ammonia-lyase, partial [Kofleriaceae bacterium]|jgi:histidine ammonia-lyase
VQRLSIGETRVTHQHVALVSRGELSVGLTEAPAWHARMNRSREAVEARARSGQPLYGVNTGFGASVVNTVDAAYGTDLAANLFRFHGCGVGQPLSIGEGRAVLVTRLAQLAAGWSGIRVDMLRAIVALLQHDIIPRIPELGSVGASGDLTPMSYVAAALAGEREVFFRGSVCSSADALAAVGIAPITLQHKETLSIMNGTSVMTALVSLALERADAFMRTHAMLTAWNSFLLQGQPGHFDERLFMAKPHPGSIQYAALVRECLACGPRPALHAGKLQDPYSIRCAPHVVGVLAEVIAQATATTEIELNGAGDNPLICEETQTPLHGGNFYGSHITHVADTLKLHLAHAAEVLERQLVLLCHSTPTSGIPANLVRVAGPDRTAHHGFKAIEILASALVAEALKQAAPASVFSRSTEGHNQDKVPMGAIAARDLRGIQELADHMLAISMLAAAQATDATGRADALPPRLRALYDAIRRVCDATVEDRRHDDQIARCLAAYRSHQLPLI